MGQIILVISCAALVSCGDPKKEVVLNMEDIIPQSKKSNEKSEKQESPEVDSCDFDLKVAGELGISVQKMSSLNDPLFLDRFFPLTKKKVQIEQTENHIFFGQWTFRDSVKTMNAFFNWLDCFGSECRSLKYLQEMKFQSDPMLLFINDTSITYISSKLPLDEKAWQQYLEKKHGIDSWKNVVIQKKNKEATWCFYGKLKGMKKKQFIPLIEQAK